MAQVAYVSSAGLVRFVRVGAVGPSGWTAAIGVVRITRSVDFPIQADLHALDPGSGEQAQQIPAPETES